MPRKKRGTHEETDDISTKNNVSKIKSHYGCFPEQQEKLSQTKNKKRVVKTLIDKKIKSSEKKSINRIRDETCMQNERPVKARKRKVAELTPTCSPTLSPHLKSQKITTSHSRKDPTTSKNSSPYFAKKKNLVRESKLKYPSPEKIPRGSCSGPTSSKWNQSTKKDQLAIKRKQTAFTEEKINNAISPIKRNTPTKEEQIEMMKDYMGERMVEDSGNSSSEDASDWEEVAEMPHFTEQLKEKEEQCVQVVVEAPDPLGLKKKRKKNSAEEKFARQWNKFMRELRLDMHKTHILCLLSYGLQRNALCSNYHLKGLALSTVPYQYLQLNEGTKQKQSGHGRIFVNKILRWFATEYTVDASVKEQTVTYHVLQKRFDTKQVASPRELLYLILLILRALLIECRLCINLVPISKKLPGKTTTQKAIRQCKKADVQKKSQSDKKGAPKPKNTSRRKKASKVTECSDCSDGGVNDGNSSKTSIEISSDDSISEISRSRSKSSKKYLAVGKASKRKKIKSSDSEDSVIITKAKEKGMDEWLEVYIDQEEQWFTVDCSELKFDCTNRIEMRATKPIIYVLGFDSKSYVRDLTPRYNSRYSTEGCKLRVDDIWWKDTLLAHSSPLNEKTDLENAQMHARVLKRPFPSRLEEFKNHPLYALERHLKKFEAIYPRTAVTLGYAKTKEPIYARECVKELHSRNKWLKEARLVRIDEKPYKVVRARKNFRKPTLPGQDTQLDLFGLWQTEEYIPPVAFQGRVPTNEYGNVDMYKPSMLPIGCVHLRLPGLNKTAKKLGKNVAPAMTGWDVHGGWSHPILDGFIVCEEDQDVLIAAWDEEQEAREVIEKAKREQIIWNHWKLLIKGVLIRERLRNRFDLVDRKKDSPTTHEKGTKVEPQLSFPACREQVSSDKVERDESNLFPFEKI